MNAAQLISIIEKSNALGKEDFKALIKLHETFPYFLIPKVLAAKYEYRVSAGESKELLHMAAVESPDRAWLRVLIEEEIDFIGDKVAEEIPRNIDTKAPAPPPENKPITTPEHDEKSAEETIQSVTSSNSSRAEVLKKLEENLNKLRSHETNQEVPSPAPEAAPKAKGRTTAKRKKAGDDLIETIKKREKKVIKDAKKQEQLDIIKAFSKKEIKLATIRENEDANKLEDLSQESTQLSDKLLSESYAKILIKQGKKEKAIDIYQKLSLKFPKKKAYFADLISDLKD